MEDDEDSSEYPKVRQRSKQSSNRDVSQVSSKRNYGARISGHISKITKTKINKEWGSNIEDTQDENRKRDSKTTKDAMDSKKNTVQEEPSEIMQQEKLH